MRAEKSRFHKLVQFHIDYCRINILVSLNVVVYRGVYIWIRNIDSTARSFWSPSCDVMIHSRYRISRNPLAICQWSASLQVLSVPLDASGVTVVPVQESHGIEHHRSIVVVQPLRQVDPLPPWRKLSRSHFWLLVGESQYFQCRQLKTRAWYVQAAEASNINAIVTHIAQTGLEQPMPPTLVVRQIEDFLAEDID
jgi:hypothetical protein